MKISGIEEIRRWPSSRLKGFSVKWAQRNIHLYSIPFIRERHPAILTDSYRFALMEKISFKHCVLLLIFYQYCFISVVVGDLSPCDLTVGDFNDDTWPDIAVVDCYSNTLQLFLGNVNGLLDRQSMYATGNQPASVIAGDFNGDEELDVIVASNDDSRVNLFLGNGDGTLQNQTNYRTGQNPVMMATGDFNNDKKLDIAVANIGEVTFSILFGRGDGTFRPQRRFPIYKTIRSIAAADFNHDGSLDLVLTVGNSPNDGVFVSLGTGNGTFQDFKIYPAGNQPSHVITADFNSDQHVDIAVVNSKDKQINILLGKGDGTFQDTMNVSTGARPVFVRAGRSRW